MSTEAELTALKVPELKELLKEASLPVSGKKQDLIQRLLDNQQPAEDSPAPAEAEQAVDEQKEQPDEEEEEAVPAPPADAAPAPQEPTVEAATESDPVPQEPSASTTRPREPEPEQEAEEQPQPKRVKVDEADSEMVDATEPAEQKEEAVVEQDKVEEPVVEEEEPPEYNFEPEEEEANRPTDMYLDTINRNVLDFDFERLCSVTLSHNNIYACLTNGKYFQGRGKTSPAYAHSIAEDNHVFINLSTQKVYILPDGYEVNDPSLDDIKYLLYPTFTPQLLRTIDARTSPSYDLQQKPYYPGFVGLNNIKANSYMNSILHALVHVLPLRDYFILDPHASDPHATELVKRFGMFCRKVWNPKAFKGQVSPHELLQECANASGKRFKITEVGDPLEFLGWLLNQLHKDLGGNKKGKSSIIYSAFQGECRIDDQQVLTTGEYGGKPRFDLDRDIKSTKSPFLFLAIDLPPPPLFQDTVEKNIIPQVPISTVLAKYDGRTTQESGGILRRFKATRLPPFLILHIKRFTKNSFVEEKNPTIVNFPLRGVDISEYVEPPPPSDSIHKYYDLVSNITHSSAAGTAREETTWKTQVHLRPPRDEKTGDLLGGRTEEEDEKWFQIQDLIVEEINRGMISLGESYIQIWERRGASQEPLVVETPKPKAKGLGVKPTAATAVPGVAGQKK